MCRPFESSNAHSIVLIDAKFAVDVCMRPVGGIRTRYRPCSIGRVAAPSTESSNLPAESTFPISMGDGVDPAGRQPVSIGCTKTEFVHSATSAGGRISDGLVEGHSQLRGTCSMRSAAPSSPIMIAIPAATLFLISPFLAEVLVVPLPYLLEVLAVLRHYR